MLTWSGLAGFYFISFIILVVFLMFNMVIAIVMKTYDQVRVDYIRSLE
jgi:hypothetical protein